MYRLLLSIPEGISFVYVRPCVSNLLKNIEIQPPILTRVHDALGRVRSGSSLQLIKQVLRNRGNVTVKNQYLTVAKYKDDPELTVAILLNTRRCDALGKYDNPTLDVPGDDYLCRSDTEFLRNCLDL